VNGDTGHRKQDTGMVTQDSGHRTQVNGDTGMVTQETGHGTQENGDTGHRTQDTEKEGITGWSALRTHVLVVIVHKARAHGGADAPGE